MRRRHSLLEWVLQAVNKDFLFPNIPFAGQQFVDSITFPQGRIDY